MRAGPEEYLVLRELIRALKRPYPLMPGNHDHLRRFRQALADAGYLPNQDALHQCIDDHPSGSWRSIHTSPENITASSMMAACAGWLRPWPRTAANRRFRTFTALVSSRVSNEISA
jgi:hypothetical protein